MNQPFYSSPAFGGPGENEEINGITYLRATRAPCPVCGHPTGDCQGGEDEAELKQIWGYNTNSSLDENQTFTVKQDYWVSHEIAPGVNMQKLLYKKGKIIPLSTAKELGLIK